MKKNFVLGLLFLLIVSACKKDTLDFSSNTYFGIEEFYESENCDTECGEAADCEGKLVKLKGTLDENNINEDIHQFWILDSKKEKISIAVVVDTLISTQVFEKIAEWRGKEIKVIGIVVGDDAPTNFTCNRLFSLKLSAVEDVSL